MSRNYIVAQFYRFYGSLIHFFELKLKFKKVCRGPLAKRSTVDGRQTTVGRCMQQKTF